MPLACCWTFNKQPNLPLPPPNFETKILLFLFIYFSQRFSENWTKIQKQAQCVSHLPQLQQMVHARRLHQIYYTSPSSYSTKEHWAIFLSCLKIMIVDQNGSNPLLVLLTQIWDHSDSILIAKQSYQLYKYYICTYTYFFPIFRLFNLKPFLLCIYIMFSVSNDNLQ